MELVRASLPVKPWSGLKKDLEEKRKKEEEKLERKRKREEKRKQKETSKGKSKKRKGTTTERQSRAMCTECETYYHLDEGEGSWIECELCLNWFHSACVGIEEEIADEIQ